jgi:hypothetical protein
LGDAHLPHGHIMTRNSHLCKCSARESRNNRSDSLNRQGGEVLSAE